MKILLDKSDLAKAKSVDRSREIEEGLKLSKRVDGLRELQAKEEENLKKYREATITAIAIEIHAIEGKKEAVQAELRLLEDELRRTLSKTDKKRLDDLKKSLEEKERFIQARSEELDLKEVDIACTIQDSENSLKKAESEKKSAEVQNKIALEKTSEVNQTLLAAKALQANALREKEEQDRGFSLREGVLASREKELSVRDAENIRMAKDLTVERTQLADQRATLQRAIERLRKNRLA